MLLQQQGQVAGRLDDAALYGELGDGLLIELVRPGRR
jgi:hypothetical protein